MIESKNIIDLTEFTSKADSPVKVEDFYPGLLPWCKPASGEGIYGLPVDCNPLVFWFNETMLADAGVDRTRSSSTRPGPGTATRWTSC